MLYSLVSLCGSVESVSLHYITGAYGGIAKYHLNNKP